MTIASAWALVAFPFALPSPAHAQESVKLTLQDALGDPDQSLPGRDYRQHLTITRPQYVLDYNNELHFPDWVAWHLGKADIGSVGRGTFTPDTSIASNGFVVIPPSDYTRSGYDRGHNCPSADRSANVADNDAVFLMTNITPQAHGMNAGPWEKLETYCRQLAQAGNELFIYCGHGFSSATHGTIGPNKIAVPDFGWKIVVVVPPGTGDSRQARRTDALDGIAVKMPNINTISRKDWREYRVSVGDIEKATGLVFFDALPKATAAALKDRVDFDQSAPSRMPAGTAPIPIVTSGAPAGTSAAAPAHASDVWGNTKSRVYWRPTARYYSRADEE